MTKNVIIALIAIVAAAAMAGAAIAVVSLGNNGNNDNGNDSNSDDTTTVTNVTMTGIAALYDGAVASSTIYVTYDDVQSVLDKISAAAVYSDNTTKSITGYTKASTLADSYAVGDTFNVTVTYGTYSSSISVKIMDNDAATVIITCEDGTEDCYSTVLNSNGEYTITFSGITADSTYSIEGNLNGNIVIDVGEDYEFELSLEGLTIASSYSVPIDIESADKVTLSAKKDTVNSITDNRSAVDDTGISACIYALADLDIQGKGTLRVTSVNNNGIHTKDDLSVKNLTLVVECKDNALKGNDSVTIQSGTVTLIAKTGDGIKTTNSDVSSKGNQRGTVTINSDKGDLVLYIYAACDGIDAAYDVDVSEGTEGTVTLNIYTDKYSSYSEEVTTSDGGTIYLKTTKFGYSYSVYFTDSNSNGKWVNASLYSYEYDKKSTSYYYSVEVPSGYSYMKVYTYTSSQTQGQSESYYSVTKQISVSSSFNVLNLSTLDWSTYGKDSGMGPGGDMGDEGNTDKGEYSTKGIKAGNSISVTGGTIEVKSYDDSIHANGGETLENSETSTGEVSISDGTITLYSNDDGIHGDGAVTISGGSVTITNCYEGIEGTYVTISGGNVSVTSSDDGINGTSTSGTAIAVSGGSLYVYAGGDGLDSNSKTSGTGIVISGGETVVISTSGGNSSIDTENGWRYTGGKIIAICPSNSMIQEVNSGTVSIGKMISKSVSGVSSGTVITVTDGSLAVAVKMPCSISPSAFVAYCGGSTSASISTGSGSYDFDSNGVYWA